MLPVCRPPASGARSGSARRLEADGCQLRIHPRSSRQVHVCGVRLPQAKLRRVPGMRVSSGEQEEQCRTNRQASSVSPPLSDSALSTVRNTSNFTPRCGLRCAQRSPWQTSATTRSSSMKICSLATTNTWVTTTPPIWQHWQRIPRLGDGGHSPIRAKNVLSARPTASNGRPCPRSGTYIRDAVTP